MSSVALNSRATSLEQLQTINRMAQSTKGTASGRIGLLDELIDLSKEGPKVYQKEVDARFEAFKEVVSRLKEEAIVYLGNVESVVNLFLGKAETVG